MIMEKFTNSLTGRQRQILLTVAILGNTRDAADMLGLSPRTVEKHSENIRARLGAATILQAAVMLAVDHHEHIGQQLQLQLASLRAQLPAGPGCLPVPAGACGTEQGARSGALHGGGGGGVLGRMGTGAGAARLIERLRDIAARCTDPDTTDALDALLGVA